MDSVLNVNKKSITNVLSCIIIAMITLTAVLGIKISTTANENLEVHAIGNWGVGFDNNGDVSISGDLQQTSGAQSWNKLIEKFKFFVLGVTSIGTVAMVLFFVYNFLKLGSTFDNDGARSKVLKGLIWSAIAAAGLGSVTIFVGFFLSIMN